MSSDGPKMEEGGMGRLGMAGKEQNPLTQGGGRRRVCRLDPGASGGCWP